MSRKHRHKKDRFFGMLAKDISRASYDIIQDYPLAENNIEAEGMERVEEIPFHTSMQPTFPGYKDLCCSNVIPVQKKLI